VWHADLAGVGDGVRELLSEREQARAERMARPRDALLWARGRGLLRELLGRYLDLDGACLELVPGPHGKPALAHSTDGEQRSSGRLCFNLSHSGESALYAFANDLDVGVDIERGLASTDVLALARRMFGQAEAARLQALDPAARQPAFLSAWVRHEAKLKCLGLGIGAGSSEEHDYVPWVQELELGPGAPAAAIAAAERPHELALWRREKI
jgi:4'-phosphopantetheinyl transferase